jgi:hypothetical protein
MLAVVVGTAAETAASGIAVVITADEDAWAEPIACGLIAPVRPAELLEVAVAVAASAAPSAKAVLRSAEPKVVAAVLALKTAPAFTAAVTAPPFSPNSFRPLALSSSAETADVDAPAAARFCWAKRSMA